MEEGYEILGGEVTDLEKLLLMKEHILRSGIPEGWFENVVDSLGEESKKPNKDLIGLAVRLMYDIEFKEVHKVWTLPGLTPEVWKNYETMGVEDLQEQELLELALKALRQRFATIHRM